MVNTIQYLIKATGNSVQVPQGQLAAVKLAVGKYLIDQVLNQSLDAGRCGILKRARGGFHNICQHHQTGFFGLWFGPWVTIVINFDGVFSLDLDGLVKKVGNQTGAMVLLNGSDDGLAQFMLAGDVHALFDVGN